MNAPHDEPVIPPRLRRPLAAVWISLGLHAAVIALLQVAPPAAVGVGAPAIEVRLVSQHDAPAPETLPEPSPAAEPQQAAPLAPSVTAEPLPVAQPAATPPEPSSAQPAAAATQPAASAPPVAAPPAATPAVAITSAVDLTYYTARDLDVQPRALREIVPEYPADADRQRLSGKVRLQLKLEADGRVSDIEVVSATPARWFEASAVQAFRDARFAPAQKNGRPVRAQVLIEVEYDWEGRR